MQLVHAVKASYEEGCYVLDGCVAGGNQEVMVFSTSSNRLRCYDARTASFLFELADHTSAITDVVTCPTALPHNVFSSQVDSGVMISDVRVGKPVHFLTEMQSSSSRCCSVSVSEDGHRMAVAINGDVHVVDTRTWSSTRIIGELHCDEISRLRFCGSNGVLCSGGEDQMINVFNTDELNEDDMMLSVVNCGEVATRMAYFAPQSVPNTLSFIPGHDSPAVGGTSGGLVTCIGSCENAFVIPLLDSVREVKLQRPNFETYQIDFVAWQGGLALVSGSKDDDGNAGSLRLESFPAGRSDYALAGAHQEVARLAFSTQDQSTLITGGEDGMIAYWRAPEAAADGDGDQRSSTSSSMKQRAAGAVPTQRQKAGRPY